MSSGPSHALPSPGSHGPPAPLECLVRHYGVTAELAGGAWFARLPAGAPLARIPYDDGKKKSFDEMLADPDVKDLFAIPYHAGPIRPVTRQNEDPGRIRLDALMQARYPTTEKDLAAIDFFGTRLKVNRRVLAVFERVLARLHAAAKEDPKLLPFFKHPGGTLARRVIAGTNRPSTHSYGIAIDISTDLTEYWRWQKGPFAWRNRTPQAIVDAFEAEGFIWGGRWYHYDTMHFEYRPELLDPSCKPGETR